MEATKPTQPKVEPKAKQKPAKKNVKGIKNAFLVIVVCFIVAVCLFLFFFGNHRAIIRKIEGHLHRPRIIVE